MYKIVIVDDEMIVRHAVKSMIDWETYEWAGSAASGQEALELVRRSDAELVITDMKMPGMDGLALIRELKDSGYGGEILVLSNYSDFELVREALRYGAHDYVLKLTLKSEQFAETLREMAAKLDQRRASRPEQSPANRSAADREQAIAWLQAADADAQDGEEEALASLLPAVYRELQGQVFVFYRQSPDEETERPEPATDFADTLTKLADGVFPGRQSLIVLPSSGERYVLAVLYPAGSRMAEAEESARRIVRLAQIYYNTSVSAIYGQPAATCAALSAQLRRCREAATLRFYGACRESCIASTELPLQEADAFRRVEQGLRDSLRTSGESAVELWMERAVELVEAAAAVRLAPAVLKRAIARTVWGMAGTAMVDAETSWSEQPWIDRIEQAESDAELLLLIREMTEEMVGVLETSAPQATIREEIRRAAAYLEERYGERIAIADVAHHVGLSEAYLCQLFKSETGSSMISRLNEIRMAKAYEMLASGQYLIKQVAISVGIPDPFYFNRLFRKRFGIAPKLVKNGSDKKMDDLQPSNKKL